MHKRRRWGRGVILVVVLTSVFALPRIAQATTLTLYDNTALSGSSASAAGVTLAQSFSTGANPVNLSAVSFSWINGLLPGSYTLDLYAGSGGVPMYFLTELATNVSVAASSQSTDTYSPGSPLALPANSQFFVEVSGLSAGSLGWTYNATAPTTDLVPPPSLLSLVSSDGGSTWSSVPGNFIMSVTGTPLTIPVISGFPDVNATPGEAPLVLSPPTTSVPGTFSYFSTNPSVATMAENQVTFGSVGTATITANFYPSDPTTYFPTSISATVTVANPPPPPPPPPPVTTTTTTTSTTTTTLPPPLSGTPTTTTTTPSSGSTTTTTTTPGTTTTTSTTPTTTPGTTTTTSTTPAPSVTTTTTPSSTAPPGTTSFPTPFAPSASTFASTEGMQFLAQIDATAHTTVAGSLITVSAVASDPGTAVTAEVHSTPQLIMNGLSSAQGTYSGEATLPSSLEAGPHVLIIRAIYQGLPVTLVGAFIKTTSGTFATIVQPAPITNFSGINDPRLQRAMRFGLPVYDVASHSRTTVGLVVAGGSLLALAGAGGAASQGLGALDRRKSHHQSKVASAVTKKLKAVGTTHNAWGDRSSTWKGPHTERVDRLSRELPVTVGPFSALLPRVIVDGSWLRAAFGGWSTLLWAVGLALGVLSVFFHSAAPFVPAVPLIFLLIGLGILDAIACMIAWLVIAVSSLVGGSLQSWSDIRTLLGLGVLFVTVPLLAHAIRPLRRYVLNDVSERWERLFDYVMMPIFVAFAAASMAKALNGLSGLSILSPANLIAIRWLVGIMIVVRLFGEDAALHFYPERSKAVQPAKLVAARTRYVVASMVFKFLLYLVVMDPYFGLTLRTVIAATLLAVPGVLKLREEKLPNSKVLHRWLPRGLTSFLFMMILGSYLSFRLLGLAPSTSTVDSTFLLLLLPGVVVGVLEIFGREGVDWTHVWMKRGLGVVAWLTAVGLVTGQLILFK